MYACISYYVLFVGRQTCINNPDAYQRGHSIIREGTQVIVPAARFDCSGRITNIAVSMRFSSRNDLPLFQVWRPALSNSTVYNKIAEVELPLGDRIRGENSFSFTNLSLNSSRQIKFNSRDVIGYYQSANSHRIRTIQTSGYISYIDEVSSPSTLIDANDTDYIYTKNQPLIEVMFGKVYKIKHSVYSTLDAELRMYIYIQLLKLNICSMYVHVEY